jgi:hypothetical protein
LVFGRFDFTVDFRRWIFLSEARDFRCPRDFLFAAESPLPGFDSCSGPCLVFPSPPGLSPLGSTIGVSRRLFSFPAQDFFFAADPAPLGSDRARAQISPACE